MSVFSLVLWVICGVLAVVFAASGAAKITMSRQRLIEMGQTGIAVYSMPVVRFTAACELLAAVGLIAPWATGVLPVLTPLAAGGLILVMLGAAYAHVRLHEPRNVAVNAVLLGLCLVVVVGRAGMLG
jgi:uncharacterized membrane protein YphA (DoxX/SURF4 family)